MNIEKLKRIILIQFGLSLMLFNTGIFISNKWGLCLIIVAIFTLLLLLQDLNKERNFFSNALGIFCSSLFIIILTKKIPDLYLKLSSNGIVPVIGLAFMIFAIYLIFVHINTPFNK